MIVAKKVNLLYWDMNNLYGFAMNQLLPYGDFNFLTKEEINKFGLHSISKNSSTSYILEVDLSIVLNCMIFIVIIH